MKRAIFQIVKSRLEESRRFIQFLLGPRYSGKTTLIHQVLKQLGFSYHYANANSVIQCDVHWLKTQWDMARALPGDKKILVLDEVQKITQWSTYVKAFWDEDTWKKNSLQVVLLGSSSWLMQQGLTESLAGRFEIIPVPQWSFQEMREAFGWDLEQYAYFGGYPGAAVYADREQSERWITYVHDTLIETSISHDILMMTQINKPALLRRLFQLGCVYSGQIISYQKMLGQLQDAGNTTTLAHYLHLLEGAGLIANISKYSNQPVRQKASSPKVQVMNTALMSAQVGKDYLTVRNNPDLWGRWIESMVGSYLLNHIRGKNIKIFYWREGQYEVDFVLQKNDDLIAIEVRSSAKKEKILGLNQFNKAFHPQKIWVVGEQGIDIETFISTPIEQWL